MAGNKMEVERKRLTDRHREIIAGIAAGKTSKQMGDEMNISYRTVQGHRRDLFKIFNVTNSTQLLLVAKAEMDSSVRGSYPFHKLKFLEKQIVDLTAAGYSAKDVARILLLKENTVNACKNRLYKKLGVNNVNAMLQVLEGLWPERTKTSMPKAGQAEEAEQIEEVSIPEMGC